MWKWTDPYNIKAIILDCDSLDDEFINYDYESIIPNVMVIKAIYLYNNKNLEDHVVEYFDFNLLIKEVLDLAQCESSSIISIGSEIGFMKNMMQYHIGTIFAGSINKDMLKNTPDFTYKTQNKLEKILSSENYGYGAEAMAIRISNKKMNILVDRAEIQLDNGIKRPIDLYFGGRYYSKSHNYFEDDPLSELLRAFKRKYYLEVDRFYDSAIRHVNNIEHIDVLTYTPLKPIDIQNGKFDRFVSLHLDGCRELGIELKNTIKCIKNFTQKSHDYNSRQLNVKGAFEVIEDVSGKHVVLIDDLYTSGATTKEIAKLLYEKGARKVSLILLAVNQMIESTAVQYKNLTCPICGNVMSLKMGKYGLFFGCNSYASHHEDTALNVVEGLKKLKSINTITDIDVVDLNDEY